MEQSRKRFHPIARPTQLKYYTFKNCGHRFPGDLLDAGEMKIVST